MPKATLRNYTVIGAIYCGIGGPEMQAGDQVRLFLNQGANPDFPDHINAVVQLPTSRTQVLVGGCIQEATSYSFEYDTEDLDGAASILRACDITEISCITCCVILRELLDELRADVDDIPSVIGSANVEVTGGTGADDPFVVTQKTDRAVSDLTVNVAYNIGTPNAPSLSLISAINKEEGDAVVVIYDTDSTPNSGDEFVVKWTIASGVLANPVILEWPEASVSYVTASNGVRTYTYRDKTGNTVTWTTNPASLTTEPLSDYAGIQQTANLILSGTVSADGNLHFHIESGLLDGAAVINIPVLNGDTSDEWGPKVLAAVESYPGIEDLYTATLYPGFPDPTLEIKAVDAAANDLSLLIAIDNGTSAGIDEVDSGDFSAQVGDAPVVGTPGFLGQVAFVTVPHPLDDGDYFKKFVMVSESPAIWKEDVIENTGVVRNPVVLHPRATSTRNPTSPYVLTSVSTKAIPSSNANKFTLQVDLNGTVTAGTDTNNPNQVRPFSGTHTYTLTAGNGPDLSPYGVKPSDYNADTNDKHWRLSSNVFEKVSAYDSVTLGGTDSSGFPTLVQIGANRSLEIKFITSASSGGVQSLWFCDPSDHETSNPAPLGAIPIIRVAYTKNADGLPDHLEVSGPYADDSAAAVATVPVGGIYYDTSGIIRRRMA